MRSHLIIRLNYSSIIMNRIKTYVNSLGRTSQAIVIGLAVIFVSASIAQAATTITTDISTGALTLTGALTGTSGTLSTTLGVTGLSSFGNASTTGNVSVAGALWVGGNATTTAAGALTLTGPITVTNPAATSTLTVGCINSTATSTATPIHFIFGIIGTTTVSGTSSGSVQWAYGSCS